jgi:hypothetical protein
VFCRNIRCNATIYCKPVHQWSACVVLCSKPYFVAWFLYMFILVLCVENIFICYALPWPVCTIDSCTPLGSMVWGFSSPNDWWQVKSASPWFTSGSLSHLGCDPRAQLKCIIISDGLWLKYLQTSLFISIYQTAVGIISPLQFANEASHFQNKFWENHDLTVQPVTTYIYLCGQIYASCLSYFLTDQKPNWNVWLALEKIYHWYFTIYWQMVFGPF